MWITDDPLADFERHDREQTRQLNRLPRCSECDHPIQDEFAYYINDEWICDDCMKQYRKEVNPDL